MAENLMQLDGRGVRAMRESYAQTIVQLAHRLAETAASEAQARDQLNAREDTDHDQA